MSSCRRVLPPPRPQPLHPQTLIRLIVMHKYFSKISHNSKVMLDIFSSIYIYILYTYISSTLVEFCFKTTPRYADSCLLPEGHYLDRSAGHHSCSVRLRVSQKKGCFCTIFSIIFSGLVRKPPHCWMAVWPSTCRFGLQYGAMNILNKKPRHSESYLDLSRCFGAAKIKYGNIMCCVDQTQF